MSLVLGRDDILGAGETRLGGKAKNLEWLLRFGFQVPPFFVISTAAFDVILREAIGAPADFSQAANLVELLASAAQIRARIKNATLPPSIQEEIRQQLKFLGKGSGFYAIRSSAVGEDGLDASFAGQMDSILFLKTEAQIFQAVLDCFASAFGDRVLQYRQERGLSLKDIRAAAICQVMIESDRSGVAFTAHPTSGSRREYLISVSWGLGEGIVSGLCNADEFTISTEPTLAIATRTIVTKDQAVRFDQARGFGIKAEAVPAAQHEVACLSDQEVLALARVIGSIADAAGRPQDIEFGFAAGELFIFQTRPITSLPAPADSATDAVVWDNSNIQESYCGVTTPLTFSFASRAYRFVYQNTGELMGATAEDVARQEPVLRNLLGLIRGKVYYNINHWYLGLSYFPSFGNNKADMERMMGLQDPIDFIVDKNLHGWTKVVNHTQALIAILRLLGKFTRIKTHVNAFNANFQRVYHGVDRSKLYRMDLVQLFELTRRLESELTKKWTAPIINDFYVMMMNGSVHRQLQKLANHKAATGLIPETHLVLNNLLSGEEGIESTEPTKFLLRLCDEIRLKPELCRTIQEGKISELMAIVQVKFPDFFARCCTYIELYGDRTMGELKLESITLREDPSFLFTCLKNYLDNPKLTIATLQRNEHRLREEEEGRVFRAMKSLPLGRLQALRLRWDLKRLRASVKNRENMRLARTRAFGLCRSIYLEMGQQLALHKQLQEPRDIFYLTVEELELFFEGRAVGTNLKGLVALRKEEYQTYTQDDLPHHFKTQGSPYFGNAYAYKETQPLSDSATMLKGIGCYPGIVEAQIRLIFSPEEAGSVQGRILCTVRTDPGWAPLFPSASGILVERGSSLSHSAVVARELGIPAVVNVPGITKILRDGEWVRMNGQTGEIERLPDR